MSFQDDVRAAFPMRGPGCELVLLDLSVDAGVLMATIQLIVRDDDGSARDIKEQQLHLFPERHWNDRALAFLSAVAASFAELAGAVVTLMPHDLFPSALLDVPELADFATALADPRARHILDTCPDDRALLATIGKPRAPSARDADLEARCDDAAACAVYGDWLSQRGDPRGELIAVQLALETRDDPALRERERELLHHNAYAWLRGFAWSHDASVTWWRGFLQQIRFASDTDEPSFVDVGWELRELGRLPATRYLQHVGFGPKGFWDDAGLDAMGEVGLPPSVTSLAITTGEYTELGELEPAYPGLANVRALRLESRAFSLGAIDMPALRDLELVTRGLRRDHLASLRELRLDRLVLWLCDAGVDDCDVELDDLAWLLGGGRGLHELGLCGRDPIAVLERVLASPILAELRVLDVAGGYLDADGATWLRDHADAFVHLERLVVPAGSAPLVIAPHIAVSHRFIPVYE